jgi:hypothetical protein
MLAGIATVMRVVLLFNDRAYLKRAGATQVPLMLILVKKQVVR